MSLTKRLGFIVFIIFTLFISPVTIFAQSEYQSNKLVVLEKYQIVNDNYLAAAESVTVSGTVNGDVYVAGGDVIIDGTVNGDVLAAGGSITISGKVTGSVRAVGGQIDINGFIGKNLSAAAGQITLSKGATLSGSLTAAAGTVDISAPVTKNIQVAAGKLHINSKVTGNVSYLGENEPVIGSGATVSGKLDRHILPQKVSKDQLKQASRTASRTFSIIWHIIGFITTLAFGLIFVKLFPAFTTRVSDQLQSQFWFSLGRGVFILILFPIAFIAVCLTVIGVPFAFFSLATFLLILYFTRIFISVFIGKWLLSRFTSRKSLYLSLLLGLLIFTLVGMVPFIGGLTKLILLSAALGAITFRHPHTSSDS